MATSRRAPVRIGSQGLEYALIAHWRAAGLLASARATPAGPTRRSCGCRLRLVLGRSTRGKIATAEASGFAGIALDAGKAVDAAAWERELGRVAELALAAMAKVVIRSSSPPADPTIRRRGAATGDPHERRLAGRGQRPDRRGPRPRS